MWRQTFQPGETIALEAGTESARIALPRQGGNCRVTNLGDRPVWLEFGGDDVVAAVPNSFVVLPMAAVLIGMPPTATHIAVVSPGKGKIAVNFTLGEGA